LSVSVSVSVWKVFSLVWQPRYRRLPVLHSRLAAIRVDRELGVDQRAVLAQRNATPFASPPALVRGERRDDVAFGTYLSCFMRIRFAAAAATWPFMSMVPRPYSQPVVLGELGNGGLVHPRARVHHVEVQDVEHRLGRALLRVRTTTLPFSGFPACQLATSSAAKPAREASRQRRRGRFVPFIDVVSSAICSARISRASAVVASSVLVRAVTRREPEKPQIARNQLRASETFRALAPRDFRGPRS
jgi:hypothetical protein